MSGGNQRNTEDYSSLWDKNTGKPSTLRIVHFIESLEVKRGGPVRAVTDLCAGLSARGHRVTLLASPVGLPVAASGSDRVDGPTIIGLNGLKNTAFPMGADAKRIAAAAIADADVVHVHGVWSLCNVSMASLAREARVPYIISLRGMLDDWSMDQKRIKKRLFMAAVGHRFLHSAAVVHCTAEGEFTQSNKWFPPENGRVVSNLLNLNPFRNAPGPAAALARFPAIAGPRPRVLFLSRIHYKKGVEVLIDAGALLKARGVEATYVIAGPSDAAYLNRLKERIRAGGIEDCTVFTGLVDGDLKISLYQACELFALPTSQENFGFVFPEALASGTPVITTKGVDIWPELLESGASSIVDRTPEAFANEIQRILQNEPARRAMSDKAKPFVFKAFDESALLDRYEAMYRSAAAAKTASPSPAVATSA